MVQWQKFSRRKSTGGLRNKARKKRKRELGRYPIETKLSQRKIKKQRVRGGKSKLKVYSDTHVNVNDGGTTKHLEILEVVHNPSNKDYDRRKIITKGTIVKTEMGTVRITSRPGQNSVINGVVVETEEY
ncbi:MAG: 30S ribosomal protein S8e [Candidatus Hodarchaeota archaeon]